MKILGKFFVLYALLTIHFSVVYANPACSQIFNDTRIENSQANKNISSKLAEEFAEITQTQKDIDMPDRFDTERDWGTRLLSDTDPTWSDPDFLAEVPKFLSPGITNYDGKAKNLLNTHSALINKFVKGRILNFTNTGTDANNMLFDYAEEYLAKKLGFKPTAMKILTFEGIYGGSYGKIMKLANTEDPNTQQIPGPYYNSNEILEGSKLSELESLENNALKLIEKQIQHKENQIGGIFMESIPVAHGVKIYRTEFLLKLRKLADRYDTPIFADEILTGGGRTGKFWAFQHYDGFIPDLVTFGKGLGTSGIFAPQDSISNISYRIERFQTTTQINPLALLQSTQILKTIWNKRLDLNAAETGKYLMGRLRYEVKDFNSKNPKSKIDITQISGVGLLITGFPETKRQPYATPNSNLNYDVHGTTSETFNVSGRAYNGRVMPILTTTKSDIEWVFNNKLNWKTKNQQIYTEEYQKSLAYYAINNTQKNIDFDMNNSITVSGKLENVILDQNQELAFVKFADKVQIKHKGKVIPGQDVDWHHEGYSMPVGEIDTVFVYADEILIKDKDWNRKDDDDDESHADKHASTQKVKLTSDWYTKKNIKKSVIREGQIIKIKYRSGLEFKGIVKRLTYDDVGNLIVMTFKQATVEYQGKILYQPEWGDYDIAVGDFATKITPK